MAKKSGVKVGLSLEEMLEKALLKDEDKPYEVPENWVWSILGSISEIIMGQSPAGEDTTDDSSFMPLIGGASDMGETFPNAHRYTKKPTKTSKVNDVILSIRATLGRPIFSDGEYCLGRGVAGIRLRTLSPKFIRWFLINTENYLYEVSTGTTFAQVSKSDLDNIPIPLPPLPEQHRIVAIIESLFEKLDRAKELAQNALDSFENRKSAILHKAFSGELTAKWREENGVDFERDWEEKILRDVCELKAGYAFDSSKFTNSGYQIIRMGNLYNGVLDLTRNPVFMKEDDVEDKVIGRSKININDILLTLTGTKYKRDYGFAVLITEDLNILLNQRILSLTAKSVEIKYLLNYLRTNIFRDIFFSNETGGVNQGNVSSKFVETITIPVSPISEQKEIVRILDTILEQEQKAKELCDVIEKIDHMKKAILARAFRGELGTNNPNEESAIELLKEVLQEQK